jgi:hypothetical protein
MEPQARAQDPLVLLEAPGRNGDVPHVALRTVDIPVAEWIGAVRRQAALRDALANPKALYYFVELAERSGDVSAS